MERDDVDVRRKEREKDVLGESVTGIQYDLDKMMKKSRQDAKTELFRWGLVKEEQPSTWNKIKRYEIYQPYVSSKKIKTKDGDVVLSDAELFRFNNYATLEYADYVNKKSNEWMTRQSKKVIKKGDKAGTSYLDIYTDKWWSASKKQAEAMIRKELKDKNK